MLASQWALQKLSGLSCFGDTVSGTVVRGTTIYRITKNNCGSMPGILIDLEGKEGHRKTVIGVSAALHKYLQSVN